ncbi:bifunctional acetate--CoA ligase family protein/GNAT family N-acetyltransferase [Streptomyces silvisoli]|uniref:GNAT family N-acetyltransferase n=1 Tax=Streptomyces silvisoli TaxID=3034235 RepID=A0ABT5ZFU7_9ACTN|nr:bifunctional GNAT family N-acetyltransferase/acetate--CoA ligase family protein [Streptomyces silvisoli]MDF3288704.1 GNAT family N-acetyltransferase [Streptomyces silvisoli]
MTASALAADGVHALLADGTTVRIRPVRTGDRDGVRALYECMSDENLRFRFFDVSRRPAEQAAERVAHCDKPGYQGLLAVVDDAVVGIAEYEADDPRAGSTSAEISVAVADAWHHRGVGTLLLEHLVHAAREAGITTFTADALAHNAAVLKVFADLGLRVSRHFEGPEVRCSIRLDEDETYLSALDLRAASADRASLSPLLRPRSVVVVGAGTKTTSVGRAVLRNIRHGRFNGRVCAVNPHAHAIARTPAYPSVSDLPHPPDLAVIAVPAGAVADVAEQCGRRGVRALVVLASGFDAEGASALLKVCRRYGMRLVGPNCLGLANTEEAVALDATFAAHPPLPGSAGVGVQSGGVGMALLDGLSRLGIGVSSFVSLGDKLDVSSNDLLCWWEGDRHTELALLHLESFGNPRAFSRTARRVARRMPVLTVDAGRSAAGRRAAAAHTAAAATPTMTRGALFSQAGITATRTIAELLDTAALLHSQPLPTGGSVAVVTNAAGAGVLAADACVEAGLTLPELPANLAAGLLADLPEGACAGNPVDATAVVGASALRSCVDRLTTHGRVDAVMVVLVPTALVRATGDDPRLALNGRRSRPVAAVLLDQAETVRLLRAEGGGAVPAYADATSAARALAHAVTRAAWLAEPPGTIPELPGIDCEGATSLVDAYLAQRPEGGWLHPRQCAELLSYYCIRQSPWSWAESEEEAVRAAALLAGRDGLVALKAHWPGLMHKSDQGAIALDLAGEVAVRRAHASLVARFGDVMTGVVVQPMAPRGVELVAGIVQDAVFGPLVLFGLGGTVTDVLADHAARLAPLTDRDVHALIRMPRCAPLLFGQRGGGPVDLEGLEQLLSRLSRMACDLPELAEADLNPVVARPDGVLTLDARVRLLPRRAQDPYLRRLR